MTAIGQPIISDLHDPNVSFEEYLYWAKLTRASEGHDKDYVLFGQTVKKKQPPPAQTTLGQGSAESAKETVMAIQAIAASKGQDSILIDTNQPFAEAVTRTMPITDEEHFTASRALRTATWGSMFYLLTMDILGPFSVPWGFAALGYGPGVVLYTVFACLATYGGILLWKMFLGLDSDRYPLRTYGDLAFRVCGPKARYLVSLLQSVQLLFNVGVIILINGLSLEQIITSLGGGAKCFIILCFVWALAGMLLGQIRTSQRLSRVANVSVWLNVFTIFAIVGVVVTSGVLTETARVVNASFNIGPNEPIMTTSGIRPGIPFTAAITGLMSTVYSFGGALIFIEFIAEMHQPFHFWKALLLAEIFIFSLYMFFGLFVYSRQGQYTFNPTYQGIAPHKWHAALNTIQLVTSVIAAVLYGNIGIKVVYNNVLVDLLRFPQINTNAGKLVWMGVVPIYWALAFIIASAIPQVSNLGVLIAATCIMQFSFTFPPLLSTIYMIKRDALLPGDSFDPMIRTVVKQDSGLRRVWRGYRRHWVLNSWNSVMFLGSAATAILGTYSAAVQIKSYYAADVGTSFSCRSPYATV